MQIPAWIEGKMKEAFFGAVDFGPGGFIGMILVFILAAILQGNRGREVHYRPTKTVEEIQRDQMFQRLFAKKNPPDKSKRIKQPRLVIKRESDSHYAVLIHQKKNKVLFFAAPCGHYRFTEKEAQRFFDQYNNGSRAGYTTEPYT